MAHDNEPVDNENIHPVSRKFLWLADEKVVKGFIWLPILGLAITYVAGFIFKFDPAHKAPWDFDWLGSWAIIGFCAYSFVVLSAEPLFKLLARREDYYGPDETPKEEQTHD